MAVVISDASVLISLASADHLELLRKLYGSVLIPSVVAREIIASTQFRITRELYESTLHECGEIA